MTNEKISPCRARRTHQCNDIVIARRYRQRRNHSIVNESVPDLPETSISIYSRCDELKTSSSNPGAENRIYGKTSQESGFFSSTLRRFHGGLLEQCCCPRPDGISQEKTAWPRDIVKDKFRCFMPMIAWAIVRFPKFTNCWFQKEFGPVVEANHP